MLIQNLHRLSRNCTGKPLFRIYIINKDRYNLKHILNPGKNPFWMSREGPSPPQMHAGPLKDRSAGELLPQTGEAQDGFIVVKGRFQGL